MMPTSRKEALSIGATQYFTGTACKKGHIANRRAKTGECLACRVEYLAAWRTANPTQVAKHNRAQYTAHGAKIAAHVRSYYADNRSAVTARQRAYQRNNLHVYAAIKARRKAAELQRTPKWLSQDDLWMITQAYELAALRTKLFGFSWHVDHVLPLQGKEVSGLHTPLNLQVIPGTENVRKGNRL